MNGGSATGFDLEKLVRPNILGLRPYQSARDAVSSGLLLDANESPFEEPLGAVLLNRYPDPRQTRLRGAIADRLGVEMENVAAGVGSDEALDWTLKVFCQPGRDLAAAVAPSYGMYRVQADIHGVELFEHPLETDFDLSAERFLRSVPERVKVLFLCSPNNPTGNLLTRSEVLAVSAKWNGVVVVDEAYVEFSGAESLALEAARSPNLVVMRTFSKAWGRAAIRLGYVVASSRLISLFLKVKAPYNLSALTQQQGLVVLEEADKMLSRVDEIRSERDRLATRLSGLAGIGAVFPSDANFVLFQCRSAGPVCARLRERGVVIRDRSSVPRLEGCLRVSVGTRSQNNRFLRELAHVLEELSR